MKTIADVADAVLVSSPLLLGAVAIMIWRLWLDWHDWRAARYGHHVHGKHVHAKPVAVIKRRVKRERADAARQVAAEHVAMSLDATWPDRDLDEFADVAVPAQERRVVAAEVTAA